MTDDLWARAGFLDDFRRGVDAVLTAIYWNYLRRIEARVRNGFPPTGGSGRVPGVTGFADHADLVQEIFMRALATEKARLAYDGKQDYWSYLHGIARNVVADHHRRRGREIPVAGRDSSDP